MTIKARCKVIDTLTDSDSDAIVRAAQCKNIAEREGYCFWHAAYVDDGHEYFECLEGAA